MKIYPRILLLSLVSLGLLASCSKELKRSFGISHASPDEYAVLKNPPLSIPPNFELTTPAEETITTQTAVSVATSSGELKTEQSVLQKEGAVSKHNEKYNALSEGDKSFMERSNHYEKRDDIKKIIETEQSISNPSNANKVTKDGDKPTSVLDKIKNWF